MRTLAAHGVLAAIGLVCALLSWRVEGGAKEVARHGSALLRCPDGLEEVTLREADKHVRLGWRQDGGRRAPWVELTRTAAEPNVREPTTESFPGNRRARAFLRDHERLYASQDLGELPAAKLEELGLRDSQARLRLVCGDQALELKLGAATFGTARIYAQRVSGGPVHLIDRALVADLRRARSLFRAVDDEGGDQPRP